MIHRVRAVRGADLGFEASGAERLESGDLVVDVGCLDVEVHPVLRRLRLGNGFAGAVGFTPEASTSIV